jgi:hypothetical protein
MRPNPALPTVEILLSAAMTPAKPLEYVGFVAMIINVCIDIEQERERETK